jgi:IS5 family transposase
VEWLLTETIEAGRRAGTVQDDHLKKVAVDTTVMEKNIAHPTDARLYETARRKLVGLARDAGIRLRQNYNRLGPRLSGLVGRYAHARQFKRIRRALRRLKGYAGPRPARHRAADGQGGRGAAEIAAARFDGAGESAAGAEAEGPQEALQPAVDCISKD